MFGGSGSSDEAKKAKDLLIAQYFGEVNLTNRMNFSAYKHAVRYFEQELKLQDEQVLAAVTTKMTVKKMTGILVATSHRLVFVANGIVHGRYFEVLEYDQMRGIGLSADGRNCLFLTVIRRLSLKIFLTMIISSIFIKLSRTR